MKPVFSSMEIGGVCVVNNNTQTKIISNRVESSPSLRSSVPTDIYIYNFPPL